MSSPQEDRGADGSRGASGAAARLTEDTAELIRQEFESVRAEITSTARRAGAGLGLLAGAAVCGAAVLLAGHQTVLRALETAMPRARAAALLTAGYLACGAALTACGCDRLRKAGVTTGKAVERVREDLPTDHR